MTDLNNTYYTQGRQLGLDCLRIVAMFFIVTHHVLWYSGPLWSSPWMSKQYLFSWLLNITAYCAVDTFALLSGYVGVQSGYCYKLSRLVRFWLLVLFYSVGITLLFAIFKPEILGINSLKSFINAFISRGVLFPISHAHYWYATAYVMVCVFAPLMNAAIDKLEKKQFEIFMVLAMTVLCFLPRLASNQLNVFGMASGLSGIWLCILYLCGGYMRRYNIPAKITRKRAMFLFLLSTILAWGSKIVIEHLTLKLIGKAVWGNILLWYLSPFMIANGVALLCFFANTDIKSAFMRKLVTIFAPATFSVYLIHGHSLVWDYFIKNFAASLMDIGVVNMILRVLWYAIAIYIACSLVDIARLWIRRRLFPSR